MSKSPNTVVVGAFVAGAFLILFSLLFMLSGNLFKRNVDVGLMIFDGSLKGLNVGAPVAFKGVPIGEVVDFDVYVDSDTYEVLTPVEVRIYSDRIKRSDDENRSDRDVQIMIERGLRAQLQLQSLLTGLLYIQLDFHPNQPPRFTAEELEKYDIPEEYMIIPTIPTDMERLTRGLQEIDFAMLAEDAQKTLSGIDRFINDSDFQELPERISSMLAAVEQLSSRLDNEIESLSPDLQSLMANSSGAMKTLNEDLPGLSDEAKQTLLELSASLNAAQETLGNVDYLTSDDSAILVEVSRAAQEMAKAGRALQSLAETLETQPESLLRGKSPLGN